MTVRTVLNFEVSPDGRKLINMANEYHDLYGAHVIDDDSGILREYGLALADQPPAGHVVRAAAFARWAGRALPRGPVRD